jgi:hypothetical protein
MKPKISQSLNIVRRMVFSLKLEIQLALNSTSSHLCCTSNCRKHCKVVVKVYGVFSSYCQLSASSRTGLFRRNDSGDSEEIVTLLMHVGTHPTRYFATLGPSRLQPPLRGGYVRCFHISLYMPPLGKRQTTFIILQFCVVLCF